MVVSAKSQSRQAFFADQEEGGSNDNLPGLHPGHEMPELRNAPRQPAAEAVIHYARFAQIGSFPEHARGPKAGTADAPAMDASAIEKQDVVPKPVKRKVAAACLTSFAFHAILFTALAIGFVVTPHEAEQEEAGEAVSVVILGDSDADQASAGNPDLEVEPKPEEVVAENVQPETVQPTEVQPTEVTPETVEAVEPQPVQPAQEVTRVSPETVTAAEPEVLTANVPAEASVVQPMATQVPEEVKPAETAEALPEPIQPEEAPTPIAKPKAVQPVEKPEVAKKEPPKKVVKKVAGSQGQNKQDSRRGASDGSESANSDRNSQAASNNSGIGTAEKANYAGKVRSRIRRAIRTPRGIEGNVMITFAVSGSGGLSSARVSQGSGDPKVDQFALDAVRRAAPFSPPPGGQAMVMTVPIGINQR